MADDSRVALSLSLSSPISSISQSDLTPLALHLPAVAGWQAGSRERRPWRRKWQPSDKVSGRVESYIYPLPVDTSHGCKSIYIYARAFFTWGKKKKGRRMSSRVLCFRCARGPLHIVLEQAPAVKCPWSFLRFNTSLEGTWAWIVITASDCTGNLPPVIDLALYPGANLLLGRTAWPEEVCTGIQTDISAGHCLFLIVFSGAN